MAVFLAKFTSRKFWALIAVWLLAIAGYINTILDGTATATLAGAASVGYMLAEALVDAARARAIGGIPGELITNEAILPPYQG